MPLSLNKLMQSRLISGHHVDFFGAITRRLLMISQMLSQMRYFELKLF